MKVETRIKEITQRDLVNIFSDALTYSTNFILVNDEKYNELCKKYKSKGDFIEDVWAKIILGGDKLVFVDSEDEDEVFDLTLKKIMNAEYDLETISNIVSGRDDLLDHDSFLQHAMFGEVVYG